MLLYWIWLTTRKNFGPRSILKLLRYFSSPEEAYRAHRSEYLLAGLSMREAEPLEDKDLDYPRRIIDGCVEKDIHILTYQDAAYSDRLRNIPDPPAVLYYKGVLPALDAEPLVAVIGSRKSSPYGLSIAKRLGYQIAACGGIVVSGLAAGGDAMAMTGAVSAYRPVIGVLGCGVDIVYPLSSRHLYEDVLIRGCLISEYPPGTMPTKKTFPARNRIISGLSLGVVVVEAPSRSGTLITANDALEQGRDVFAVPGAVDAVVCAGSNRLLKEGAIFVESGWDVMSQYEAQFPGRIRKVRAGAPITIAPEELRANRPAEQKDASSDKKSVDNPSKRGYIDIHNLPGLTSEERKILEALERGPRFVDQIISECGGGPGQILSSLTLLEIKKYVVRLPANRYELAGGQ